MLWAWRCGARGGGACMWRMSWCEALHQTKCELPLARGPAGARYTHAIASHTHSLSTFTQTLIVFVQTHPLSTLTLTQCLSSETLVHYLDTLSVYLFTTLVYFSCLPSYTHCLSSHAPRLPSRLLLTSLPSCKYFFAPSFSALQTDCKG